MRFLSGEFATTYGALQLPKPLPSDGAPHTEITIGGREGLPVYCTPPKEPHVHAPDSKCYLCWRRLDWGSMVLCCPGCGALSHVRCLAARMLQDSGDEVEIIPSEGSCPAPACGRHLLWWNLVRGVCAYQPPLSGEGDYCGRISSDEYGAEGVKGPLVWRVYDSSDDEEDDDRTSDNDDNASVGEINAPVLGTQESEQLDIGGHSSSGDNASSDVVAFDGVVHKSDVVAADDESDSDDSFWRLDGSSTRTQATLPCESKEGESKDPLPIRGLVGHSTRDVTSSRSPQTERACARDDVRVFSRKKANGGCGTEYEGGLNGEGGGEDESLPLSPKLSLVERLRLKRSVKRGC